MIDEQMARAKQILKDNEAGHHAMADLLIEKEVITHEDVERILGPRQWKSRGDELIADNRRVTGEQESPVADLPAAEETKEALSENKEHKQKQENEDKV